MSHYRGDGGYPPGTLARHVEIAAQGRREMSWRKLTQWDPDFVRACDQAFAAEHGELLDALQEAGAAPPAQRQAQLIGAAERLLVVLGRFRERQRRQWHEAHPFLPLYSGEGSRWGFEPGRGRRSTPTLPSP